MKDTFFSQKRYQGLYEPVYRFREFGDLDNYWIRLRYLCNRDDWQSVKTPKGAALDFNLLNEGGEKIFGGIPPEHLAVLKGRGYSLGGCSEPEPVSDDESVVSVSETYVYAPNKTYTIFDSDIVPIWGMKDDDLQTQSNIIFPSLDNIEDTFFYRNTTFRVDNPGVFKTGDRVIAHFDCKFAKEVGAGVSFAQDAWLEIGLFRVVKIDGNIVELAHNTEASIQSIPKKYSSGYNYCTWRENEFFMLLRGENPSPNETYLYLQPLSLDDYPNAQHYLYRAYATREFKNRERQTKEEITFSLEYPDMSGIEMLVPQQQTGFEYKEITRETVPTPQEWKAKVSAGEWFVYAEPRVSYDADNGVYELRVKKTPCI